MNDPAFKHYRVKFGAPKEGGLSPEMYNCGGYFKAPSDSDSIRTDSLHLGESVDEFIELDEHGNPMRCHNPESPDEMNSHPNNTPHGEATHEEEKQKTI